MIHRAAIRQREVWPEWLMSLGTSTASLSGTCVAALLFGTAPAARAEPYTIERFDAPAALGALLIPTELTEYGEVLGVGYSSHPPESWQAFARLPGPRGSLGPGMHDVGRVTRPGPYAAGRSMQGAWLGQGGRDASSKRARAVASSTARGRVFLNDGSAPEGVELESMAFGASASGVIVGVLELHTLATADAPRSHAARPVMWASETAPVVQLAIGDELPHAQATDANDSGEVVGKASASSHFAASMTFWFPKGLGEQVAVIWRSEDAPIVRLESLLVSSTPEGWRLLTAECMNNAGQIAGVAIAPDGKRVGYLLTPAGRDFDGNGTIDAEDSAQFLSALDRGDHRADYNRDGQIDPRDRDAFADGGTPRKLGSAALAEAKSRLQYALIDALSVLAPEVTQEPGVACSDLVDWNAWKARADCWNDFHVKFNLHCYGCDGGERGTADLDGKNGWSRTDEGNPYAPHGGPGGRGAPGTLTRSPGSGGDGGNGGEGGNGGVGGAGGDAAPGSDANGGRGGAGGHAGNQDPSTGVVGSGGNGGAGGRGDGRGAGGDGGAGGDAGRKSLLHGRVLTQPLDTVSLSLPGRGGPGGEGGSRRGDGWFARQGKEGPPGR
jgi:hypothetical protein